MIQSSPWLPHPLLSATLLAVWLLLNNTLAPGHIALGVLLAIAIPWLTRPFWPVRGHVRRPLALLRLAATVLYDIIVANLVVARIVLNLRRTPRARFIELPLDVQDEFCVAFLAGIITLTPGTVSAAISPDRRRITLHVLHLVDERHTLDQIKRRYEAPIKEIFGCCAPPSRSPWA